MKISFIHSQMLVHVHVNRTHFHVKGFALGNRLLEVSVRVIRVSCVRVLGFNRL